MTREESRAYSSVAARIAQNAAEAVTTSLQTDFGLLLLLEKNNKRLTRIIRVQIEVAMRRAVEAINTGVRQELEWSLRPSLTSPPQSFVLDALIAFCSVPRGAEDIRRHIRTHVRSSDERLDWLIGELVRSRVLVRDPKNGLYVAAARHRPVRLV